MENSNIYSLLCDYYDTFLSKECPLFTKSIKPKDALVISFDKNGYRGIGKLNSEETILIPVTEDSLSRTGTDAWKMSHPVSDNFNCVFKTENGKSYYIEGLSKFIGCQNSYKDDYIALKRFVESVLADESTKKKIYDDIEINGGNDKTILLFKNLCICKHSELYNDKIACGDWASGYQKLSESNHSDGGDCFLTGHKVKALGNEGRFPSIQKLGKQKIFTSNDEDCWYDGCNTTTYGMFEAQKIVIAINFLYTNSIEVTASDETKKEKKVNKTTKLLNRIDISNNEHLILFQTTKDEDFAKWFDDMDRQIKFNKSDGRKNSTTAIKSYVYDNSTKEDVDDRIEESNLRFTIYGFVLKTTIDGFHNSIVGNFRFDGSSVCENLRNFKKLFVADGISIPLWTVMTTANYSEKADLIRKVLMEGKEIPEFYERNLIRRISDKNFKNTCRTILAIENYNSNIKGENETMNEKSINFKYGELFGYMCAIEDSYNYSFYNKGGYEKVIDIQKRFAKNPIVCANEYRSRNSFKFKFLNKMSRTIAIKMFEECLGEISEDGKCEIDSKFIIGQYSAMKKYRDTIKSLKKHNDDGNTDSED